MAGKEPKKLYRATNSYGPHRGNIRYCTVQDPAVFLGSQLVVRQKWRMGDRRLAVELPTTGWRDTINADDIHSLGMQPRNVGSSSTVRIHLPNRKSDDHKFHDRRFDDYRYEGNDNRLKMLSGKPDKTNEDFNFFNLENSTNIFTAERDNAPQDSPNTINYHEEFRADLLTCNFLTLKCGDSVFSKPDYSSISKDYRGIRDQVFNAVWNAIGIHIYRNKNCASANFDCSFGQDVAERVSRDGQDVLRPTEKLCLKAHLFIKIAAENSPASDMKWYRVDENDLVDITASVDKEYHHKKRMQTADGRRRENFDRQGTRRRGIQQIFVLLTQEKDSSDIWQPYFSLEEAYCDGDKVFPYGE